MSVELDRFFRCERTAAGWEFQVMQISWLRPDGPCEEAWKSYRCWRTEPDAARLAQAKASALLAPRFFRACRFCDRRDATGNMVIQNGASCMDCAEKHLGIIF